MTYGSAVGVPVVLIIGFLYDTLGRKVLTAVTFLVGAVTTMLFPLVVSDDPIGYDIVKVIYLQTFVVMLSNPFINDYVTVQSRGLATGF